MKSIDDKILSKVSKRGKGTILFSSEFTDIAEPKSVLKSLEQLARSEEIIRIARGILPQGYMLLIVWDYLLIYQ